MVSRLLLQRIGFTFFLFLFFGSAVVLWPRWKLESAQRSVAIAVDWDEVQELSSRLHKTDDEIFRDLRDSGVRSIVFSQITLKELIQSGRARIVPSSTGDRLEIKDEALRGQLLREWHRRGVRDERRLEPLGDIEAGFDTRLLARAQEGGFLPVLRFMYDPWLRAEELPAFWADAWPFSKPAGFFIGSDLAPGGKEADPLWREWLASHPQFTHFVFEFRTSKAALQLGKAHPNRVIRAHSLPSAEAFNLTPAQIQARLVRAAEERACRFLYVHVSMNDSYDRFLAMLVLIRQALDHKGWVAGIPSVLNANWTALSRIQTTLQAAAGFAFAVIVPPFALWLFKNQKGLYAFALITVTVWAGGLVVSAAAQNAETQLQLTAFRGIKAAFLLSWFGCFAVLFSYEDIVRFAREGLQRWEAVAGILLAALIGYVLVRTGNSAPSWRSSNEQGVRDFLEGLFVARPRFKEFAVGYPLLLLGVVLKERLGDSFWVRGLIGFGMIGCISAVNTFCHLHSPIELEMLRTFNGLLLGSVLGLALSASILFVLRAMRRR